MTARRTVTIAVTQEHIGNSRTHVEGGLNARDPIELAVLDAIPEAVDAQDWFSDAEVREMCVTVWLDKEQDRRFTVAFTFPPEAFDFINDFVDGKPVSPFTVTAEATA